MTDGSRVALTTLAGVLMLMVGEAAHAARNERRLLARGAVEPAGDVYRTMRWAYPLCFIAMCVEGTIAGAPPRPLVITGLVTFAIAKALKYWAVAALADRWTFRVLVLPSTPLVATGPYAYLRHPNYVAVVGELVGISLALGAPVTGTAAVLGFGWLLLRRIAVEDRALGRGA
jgi:methyltransferase